VCDEAVSALDVSIRRRSGLLARMRREQHHADFRHHNLAVVRQICDRIQRELGMGRRRVILHAHVVSLGAALDPVRERERLATLAVPGELTLGDRAADGLCLSPLSGGGGPAPEFVQRRRSSRIRTRWPACAGATL
jgi:hypothetical protein